MTASTEWRTMRPRMAPTRKARPFPWKNSVGGQSVRRGDETKQQEATRDWTYETLEERPHQPRSGDDGFREGGRRARFRCSNRIHASVPSFIRRAREEGTLTLGVNHRERRVTRGVESEREGEEEREEELRRPRLARSVPERGQSVFSNPNSPATPSHELIVTE